MSGYFYFYSLIYFLNLCYLVVAANNCRKGFVLKVLPTDRGEYFCFILKEDDMILKKIVNMFFSKKLATAAPCVGAVTRE